MCFVSIHCQRPIISTTSNSSSSSSFSFSFNTYTSASVEIVQPALALEQSDRLTSRKIRRSFLALAFFPTMLVYHRTFEDKKEGTRRFERLTTTQAVSATDVFVTSY